MSKTNSEPGFIDCFKCKHMYITWEVNCPRGCKAFGFKTKRMPSMVVFETSGEVCLKFTPKNPQKTKKKTSGWIA